MANTIELSRLIEDKSINLFIDHSCRAIESYYNNVILTRINIADITPLTQSANQERLDRACKHLQLIQSEGITPYRPYVYTDNNSIRLVMPPLIESSPTGTFLIDGTHRLLAAIQMQVESVYVLIAKATSFPPLPCTPSNWNNMLIYSGTRRSENRFSQFDAQYFRPASAYFNSGLFVCSSMPALLQILETSFRREQMS